MTASSATPFTAQLRVWGESLRLGAPGQPLISIRVQIPEIWNVVRFEVPPGEPVISVKVRALEEMYPRAAFHDEFVLKLHGWEILDENQSLAEIGVTDGSILLLTYRDRRPVR